MDPGLDEKDSNRLTGSGISFSNASFWSRKQASGTGPCLPLSSLLCIRSDRVKGPCRRGPLSSNVLRNSTKTRDETKAQRYRARGQLFLDHRHSSKEQAVWPAPPSIAAAGAQAEASALPTQAAGVLSAPDRGTAQKRPRGSNRWHGISDSSRGIDTVVASVSLICEYTTDPHADSPGSGVNLERQSPSWKAEKG